MRYLLVCYIVAVGMFGCVDDDSGSETPFFLPPSDNRAVEETTPWPVAIKAEKQAKDPMVVVRGPTQTMAQLAATVWDQAAVRQVMVAVLHPRQGLGPLPLMRAC